MSGIRLEWAQFGDFDGFDVLRSDSPMNVDALPIPIIAGLPTMYYIDTTVVDGAAYYYRVRTWRDGIAHVGTEVYVVAALDQYWNKVVLLAHMDDTAADLSALKHIPTTGSAVSYVAGRFGKACSHNGMAQSAIKYSASDFGFNVNQDFTIELYASVAIKPTGFFYSPIGTWSDSDGWCIFFTPTGLLVLLGSTGIGVDFTYGIDEWYHLAIERFNNVCTVYFNGEAIASGTHFAEIASRDLFIGGNATSTDWFYGLVDEVRITKGQARYQGNFIVSSQPYVAG